MSWSRRILETEHPNIKINFIETGMARTDHGPLHPAGLGCYP